MNHAVNHHSTDVAASEITAKSASPGAVAEHAAQPAQERHDASTTISHAGPRVLTGLAAGGPPPGPQVTRCSAVVNEVAKKRVSTRPRARRLADVIRGRERLLRGGQRVAPRSPSRCVRVVKIEFGCRRA